MKMKMYESKIEESYKSINNKNSFIEEKVDLVV